VAEQTNFPGRPNSAWAAAGVWKEARAIWVTPTVVFRHGRRLGQSIVGLCACAPVCLLGPSLLPPLRIATPPLDHGPARPTGAHGRPRSTCRQGPPPPQGLPFPADGLSAEDVPPAAGRTSVRGVSEAAGREVGPTGPAAQPDTRAPRGQPQLRRAVKLLIS